MTKDELKKLRKLKRERDDLERRVKDRRLNPHEEVADTVKDYRTGTPRTIVIRGYGDTEWQKVRDRYLQKVGKINQQILQMEDFLESVSDPEMRYILRLRYEDGLTHEEIAQTMDGATGSAVQKREERFWNGGAK